MKYLKYLIWLLVIVIIAGGAYLYWQHERQYPSTDDAYVNANIITIAPQVNGKIKHIFVKNNQTITAGQVLFEIDPKPFTIALHKAQAQLTLAKQTVEGLNDAVAVADAVIKQRQAELIQARQTYERTMPLVKNGTLPKSNGDSATSEFTVAKAALIAARQQYQQAVDQRGENSNKNANIDAARAGLHQAKLNLQYTRVKAPTAGTVSNLSLRVGNVVSQGQQLFAIVENSNWWLDANFKETQLARIQPGQRTNITLDMYPRQHFIGTVESISKGSGSTFSLLPPENATGNWVKVTQRFPVRIHFSQLNPRYPLRVGASGAVTIDTAHKP